MANDVKGTILGFTSDLMSDFLYYNRKECEQLKVGDIELAILCGDITVQEILEAFKTEIDNSVKDKIVSLVVGK